MTRAVAVIPARGGSKGVPRKNLAVIAGRPLLTRAVQAATAAASVIETIVSTDDDEIAAAAEQLGVMVVRRPAELATDTAPTPPVVLHALDQLSEDPDIVVLLQPPAPLRTGADVDAAVAALRADPILDSVVSVYQVGDEHPARMYSLDEDGVLVSLFPDLERHRRQDLPAVYHRNGAIYATEVPALRETGELLAGRVGAYVMDASSTVNIDTLDDLAVADLLVARWDASQHA